MSSNSNPYGLAKRHPLSQLRTEMVWEGNGNRREADIASCALPMQMIETIDPPRSGLGLQSYLT